LKRDGRSSRANVKAIWAWPIAAKWSWSRCSGSRYFPSAEILRRRRHVVKKRGTSTCVPALAAVAHNVDLAAMTTIQSPQPHPVRGVVRRKRDTLAMLGTLRHETESTDRFKSDTDRDFGWSHAVRVKAKRRSDPSRSRRRSLASEKFRAPDKDVDLPRAGIDCCSRPALHDDQAVRPTSPAAT